MGRIGDVAASDQRRSVLVVGARVSGVDANMTYLEDYVASMVFELVAIVS